MAQYKAVVRRLIRLLLWGNHSSEHLLPVTLYLVAPKQHYCSSICPRVLRIFRQLKCQKREKSQRLCNLGRRWQPTQLVWPPSRLVLCLLTVLPQASSSRALPLKNNLIIFSAFGQSQGHFLCNTSNNMDFSGNLSKTT